MIITLCFALGCFLVVVSLPLGSAGVSVRRVGACLILGPLVASVLWGTLKVALQEGDVRVGLSATVGVIVLSFVAYAVLKVRKRMSSSGGQGKRIATKRPYIHQRGRDVMTFIKEQLNRDE
ncbi:MAG: hypothetical protein WB973_17110 [Thermoanaerobaculia bacterium]